jgi:hypothetical protein
MDALSQVERQYGFTLPGTYRSFVQRGYVTYPSDAYLWVHEAEWLPTVEMLDRGGFWGNPKPGLVAFAFSGRRDLWAWQTHRVSELGEPVIALCPRDCLVGDWYAPSLLGWLYRIALEYPSSMWDDEPETKQNLRRWAWVLREFGKRQWADVIESLASRAVTVNRIGPRDKDVENSLISLSEVNDRVITAFGPGFIDSPYTWDIDGEQSAG